MSRSIPPAVLLLALGACHSTEHVLQVSNGGLVPVRVEVRYTEVIDRSVLGSDVERTEIRDVIRLLDVPPATTLRFRFPPEELAVVVFRVSDGRVLFQERLTEEEFHDEHGTVEIAVYP